MTQEDKLLASTVGGVSIGVFARALTAFIHAHARALLFPRIHRALGEQTSVTASKFSISRIIYNKTFDNLLVLAGKEVTVWDAHDGMYLLGASLLVKLQCSEFGMAIVARSRNGCGHLRPL